MHIERRYCCSFVHQELVMEVSIIDTKIWAFVKGGIRYGIRNWKQNWKLEMVVKWVIKQEGQYN